MMKNKKIIVLGLSPTGKYVGKEAHLLKIKALAFDFKNGAAKYSRYFEHTQIVSENDLVLLLRNTYLNDGTTYYILPTSDEWVEFIHKNQDLFLNTNLKTSSSYLDGSFRILADKFELLKISKQLNLNYPESLVYKVGIDEKPELDNLVFPVFVKPSNRSGLAHLLKGSKGWYFEDLKSWKDFNEFNTLDGVELLIQEVIIGPESNIKVLGAIGNKRDFKNTWVGIKQRQYPQGFGSASLVSETNDTELDQITNSLISNTNYSGYFALETKYCDVRKKTYIIEVNTRPGLWFGVTTTSGNYFVKQWFESLSGEKLENPVIDTSKPVVWKYLYKDWFVSFKQRGNVSSSKLSLKEYKISFAVFDWKDLKPFVFDIFNGVKKLVKR